MQGVSSLFEMFQRYFEADIMVPILIAAVPWLLGNLSKKQKLFLTGILFLLVVLFNGLTFWIMERIGESETYYRFFWVLPFGCLVSGLILKIWEQLRETWQKAVFVLIACLMFFLYSDVQPEQWKPRDLYYLPEETMAIADMIKADSDGKVLVRVFDYSKATYGIREYNANIVLVDDGGENALDDIFKQNLVNVTGRLINAVILNNNIEYVYVEKEKTDAQMALMAGGASFVGETDAHRIYDFALEKLEPIYNKVIYSGSATEVWGMEFTSVPGVSKEVSFLYEPDGNVWTLDEQLEKKEKCFNEEKEYEAIDFGEFTLCMIDNNNADIQAETLVAFEKLLEQKKPIILLLRKPVSDGVIMVDKAADADMQKLEELILAEESPILSVYATGYEKAYRGKLPNGGMQCVCIPTIDGGSVILTIKGE